MLKQLQPQHLAIWELKLELPTIESRIVLMDNPMIVRTDDNDIRGIVVLRCGEVINVVGLHHAVAIFATYALAAYLIAVVVELFQLADDAAIYLAVFH